MESNILEKLECQLNRLNDFLYQNESMLEVAEIFVKIQNNEAELLDTIKSDLANFPESEH